jgi:hypothetical protein
MEWVLPGIQPARSWSAIEQIETELKELTEAKKETLSEAKGRLRRESAEGDHQAPQAG